jgi:hypothetical protein
VRLRQGPAAGWPVTCRDARAHRSYHGFGTLLTKKPLQPPPDQSFVPSRLFNIHSPAAEINGARCCACARVPSLITDTNGLHSRHVTWASAVACYRGGAVLRFWPSLRYGITDQPPDYINYDGTDPRRKRRRKYRKGPRLMREYLNRHWREQLTSSPPC